MLKSRLKSRSFQRDRSGNAAMIVALCLPVVLVIVGGAIDFGRAIELRSEMQDAADVASLAAIAVNSPGYKAGTSMTSDGAIAAGVTQAKAVFATDMRAHDELTGTTVTADVNKISTVLKATVTVNSTYKPFMLGMMGLSTMPLTVTSTSSATVPPYIDFYLLLDNSPSMGVGATTADIDKMVANTSDKCAFACHQRDKPSTGLNRDYYSLAKALGVTTRIDVVRQATQNLMTTAQNTETISNQYRMAIYHFGTAADAIDAQAPKPYLVSALSANLTQAATNAAAIDLMVMPSAGYNSDRQTNFNSMLAEFNTNIITSVGSGTSAGSPQKVLFFVSDGANDSYDCAYSNGNTCRRITPIDTTTCTALKAKGVRIAVLYTTYLPLPTNAFYNQYLAKYVTPTSQLASQMQACASSGLYFEVGPNQGISEAMSALFTRVISVVRINS
jgi:Flp pilus assembly protein TadG